MREDEMEGNEMREDEMEGDEMEGDEVEEKGEMELT